MTVPRVSLHEQLIELRREEGQRRAVYPRFVASGSLSQAEADRRQAHLAAARATLEYIAKHWRLFRDLAEQVAMVERHPLVKQILAAFPGAEITGLRSSQEHGRDRPESGVGTTAPVPADVQ